jgi:hypothetical protein
VWKGLASLLTNIDLREAIPDLVSRAGLLSGPLWSVKLIVNPSSSLRLLYQMLALHIKTVLNGENSKII